MVASPEVRVKLPPCRDDADRGQPRVRILPPKVRVSRQGPLTDFLPTEGTCAEIPKKKQCRHFPNRCGRKYPPQQDLHGPLPLVSCPVAFLPCASHLVNRTLSIAWHFHSGVRRLWHGGCNLVRRDHNAAHLAGSNRRRRVDPRGRPRP